MLKSPPAMQERQVQPLGWQDPPEKGMAARSSILTWRIAWTEEPGGLQSMMMSLYLICYMRVILIALVCTKLTELL